MRVSGVRFRVLDGSISIVVSWDGKYAKRGWVFGGRGGFLFCDSMAAMNRRKPNWITGAFVILFGVLALLRSLSNPRMAAAHGSDRLQLIAVGLCFGIGASLLAGLFRFPSE
ncbi:hypothetical protein SAMN05421819_4337 [Bryocella elongata]|uniref:Uncharacterized protein n=1 Tax=Bryocella elongata TaxID=863522 RepID=A0A1H6CAD9_9BACT|nr:hypothetical protein SAMN05421819_4337 [Bryocella elongata]